MTTRKFKITYVGHIIFLLDSMSLASWPLPRRADCQDWNLQTWHPTETSLAQRILPHGKGWTIRSGLRDAYYVGTHLWSSERNHYLASTSNGTPHPGSLLLELHNFPLQIECTCPLCRVGPEQPEPDLLQCLDRAGFLKSQVEHLVSFGNITSSNS